MTLQNCEWPRLSGKQGDQRGKQPSEVIGDGVADDFAVFDAEPHNVLGHPHQDNKRPCLSDKLVYFVVAAAWSMQ